MLYELREWIVCWRPIILAVIGLLVGIFLILVSIAREEARELERGYPAWVKQTGNPKELTFEEWCALKKVMTPEEKVTVLFIR